MNPGPPSGIWYLVVLKAWKTLVRSIIGSRMIRRCLILVSKMFSHELFTLELSEGLTALRSNFALNYFVQPRDIEFQVESFHSGKPTFDVAREQFRIFGRELLTWH